MNNNEDFEMIEEDIEVLEESEEILDFEEEKPKEGEIIDVNRLFDLNEEKEIEEEKQKLIVEKNNDNKIFKIQIILIVSLIVIGLLFYFFGYNLVEPYIKID